MFVDDMCECLPFGEFGIKLLATAYDGLDDFSHAKQAISYGVTEYLVKPCLPEDIITALEKAKAACDADRAIKRENVLYNKAQVNNFINKLIHSSPINPQKVNATCKELNISLFSDSFALVRIQFCRLKGNESGTYSEEKIIKAFSENFENIFFTDFNADHIYILSDTFRK